MATLQAHNPGPNAGPQPDAAAATVDPTANDGGSTPHPSRGSPWRFLRRYVLLVLLAVFFAFPFLFMVVGAFKPDDRVLADGASWKAFVPFGASLDNFTDAFSRAEFGRLFLNSVLITTCIVLGGLVVNSLAGYALARMRFRGRKLLLGIVVTLAIIPFQAIAIPLLFMMARIEWLDTYRVQIIPFLANPFFIYLFYSFFLGIPRELEEAARVDGAGPVTIFTRVIVPIARPVYATVAILSFLFSWGELLWPVLVTRGSTVRPLSQGMAVFQTQPPIQWGDIMAFATMTTLPILILFLVFQRAFVQGVSRTGLKG
ncbi:MULTISPECIES: carbohydrate ABC transporter permease [unclassified Frankia]|uniref:carbohydrate ABC transporter permease n=1 Tax=unclassified Frankia TaxID=2632575 RepID=UPI002AD3796C|nr:MULTISPECIES: carbohydrate ABC transporter permease [unclassified Frankia]